MNLFYNKKKMQRMKNIEKVKKSFFNLKKKIKLDDLEKSTSQQINKKRKSYCCFQITLYLI